MSAKSPAFDPETEAFLARIREGAKSAPKPPPLRGPQDRIAAAADAEVEAILARVNKTENIDGAEQQIAQPSEGAVRRRAGGDVDPEATDSTADEDAAQSHTPKPVESQQGEEVAAPRRGKCAPTKEIGVGLMPHRMAAKDSSIARHASPKAEAGAQIMTLADDHPAIFEGRTLFPESVHNTWDSPRFLVSGKNNPKLGGEFRKGPWTGFPLYQLSLEERATCPRSCLQWKTCYGAGMPFARRNDHRDPDFLYALKAEVVTMARAHPNGFVVRLHTLGDFYSVEYVQVWADLLDALPNLRIFGYTARREDEDDDESRRIAKAIRWLTEQAWDLFAIRFSGQDGAQGSIVVSEPDERDHVIMCPAQVYATHACVTCGLCSSPEAKDKAIGFLLHGRKVKTPVQKADRKETLRLQRIERAQSIVQTASPSPSQNVDGDPGAALAQSSPERAPATLEAEKGSAADVIAAARTKISAVRTP